MQNKPEQDRNQEATVYLVSGRRLFHLHISTCLFRSLALTVRETWTTAVQMLSYGS